MAVQVPKHLKDLIGSIRADLPSRPSAAEYAPHYAMLSELGFTDDQINAAFGWETTKRYLREVKRAGRMDGSARIHIEKTAVPADKLAPEYAAMLEFTADAFIAFYNRFCDKPMPAHCESWVQDAFNHKLLLLNVPPRHNKSTLFAVWWTVWNLVRDRDYQMLIVSLSDTLASRWVGYIAAILAHSEVPQVFGRFKPEKMDGELPWQPSKGQIMILGRRRSAGSAMQFSVLSRGQGAQILGFEADGIIGDDVTTKKIATSEIVRQEQIEWWEESVMSRFQRPDNGRVIVIGQRVHMNDIYGYLQEKVRSYGANKGEPVYHHISYPAVLRDPDPDNGIPPKVLWPEVWSYERLMGEVYDEVGGAAAWATMYQQDPQSADEVLVREEWLQQCHDLTRGLGEAPPAAPEGQEFIPVARVVSLDPSGVKYNGMVIADVISGRDAFWVYVLEVKSFKAGWHGIREEIFKTIERYNPQYFLFEKNYVQEWASGDPFIEDLRKRVRVIEHTTSSANKFAEDLGLESLAFEFEMSRISLPYKDALAKGNTGILEREIRNWTREGRIRDDVLMALWFIKYNWRKLTPLNNLATTFKGHKQVAAGWYQRAQGQKDIVAEFRRKRLKRAG